MYKPDLARQGESLMESVYIGERGFDTERGCMSRVLMLLESLPKSTDREVDLRDVDETMKGITCMFNDQPREINAVRFLLSFVEDAVEKGVMETVILALKVLERFVQLSSCSCRFLATRLPVFVRVLPIEGAVFFLCPVLSAIFQLDPMYAAEFAIQYNAVSVIVDVIQKERVSERTVGIFFRMLAVTIRRLKVDSMGSIVNEKPLCYVMRDVVLLYIRSDSKLIKPFALDCLAALAGRWPFSLSELISVDNVLGYILLLTEGIKVCNESTLEAMRNLLHIWKVWIPAYMDDEKIGTAVIARLGPALAHLVQSGQFSQLTRVILMLLAQIAFHPSAVITNDISNMLTAKLHTLPYDQKENILLIFCEKTRDSKCAEYMVEQEGEKAARFHDLLTMAFDVAEGSMCSRKFTLTFLRAIHAVFCADNDLVDTVLDRDETCQFLHRCDESPDHDVGNAAHRILELFFDEH